MTAKKRKTILAAKKRKRLPPDAKLTEPGESAAAIALTTCWMLAILTSLICNLGSIAAHVAVRFWPQAAGLQLLAGLLLFGAVVVGLFTLLLTPLIQRARRTPAPKQLVAFGVLFAIAPLAALLLRLLK